MSEKFHVYLLIDPLIDSDHWQDQVFYVGKGTGHRALHHELESGESEKRRRIRQIRNSGQTYSVLYATWQDRTGVDSKLMSEKDAFRLEAALIVALRPQLTNRSSGHELKFQSAESLQILTNAQPVNFPADVNALVVEVMGVRGGTDLLGSFVSPHPDYVWENTSKWWVFGEEIRNILTTLLTEARPVVLVAVTSSRKEHPNIVVGVFQIDSFYMEPSPHDKKPRPKVVFERKPDSEMSQVTNELREALVGNTLCVDGRPMVLSQRRMRVSDREAAGWTKFHKTLGPAFSKRGNRKIR